MAHLGSRTTSGDTAWDKYVYKNKNWKELVLDLEINAELNKRKGFAVEAIQELPKGAQLTLKSNRYEIIGNKKYAKVEVKKQEGLVNISAIRKPTNFKPTGYEVEVVNLINKHIGQNNNMPIDLKIKGSAEIFKGISGAVQVDTTLKRQAGITSDPKADIILYSNKTQLLSVRNIYISHKKEGGPEAFQQYGGLSKQAGEEIYNHVETQEFLKQVAEHIDPSIGLKTPLWKHISSTSLKNMSIYGEDFHRQFGLNHTQIIGQGLPVLTPTREDNLYELDFSSHMSLSGNLSHFIGGYLPVFGATYRAGRGFEVDGKKYNGARVGIYPIKLIGSRKDSQELK